MGPEIAKILVKYDFIWPEMGGGECGRSAKLLPIAIDSKMSDCTFQSFEFFSPLKSCWAEKSPDRLVPTTRGELLNFGYVFKILCNSPLETKVPSPHLKWWCKDKESVNIDLIMLRIF